MVLTAHQVVMQLKESQQVNSSNGSFLKAVKRQYRKHNNFFKLKQTRTREKKTVKSADYNSVKSIRMCFQGNGQKNTCIASCALKSSNTVYICNNSLLSQH